TVSGWFEQTSPGLSRLPMIRTNRTRSAFTLVELMVAAAICILIMTILASVFQTGLDAMRQMRSAGDMTDQLRASGEVMKRDFQAEHFSPVEAGAGTVNSPGTQLGDYLFPAAKSTDVVGGFYRIVSPASTYEGNDGSFDSFRGAG